MHRHIRSVETTCHFRAEISMKRFQTSTRAITALFCAALFFSFTSCDTNDSPVSSVNDSGYGEITGRVSYKGGTDFSGVTVTLEDMTDGVSARVAAAKTAITAGEAKPAGGAVEGSILMTTVTGADGSYAFSEVPPGDYLISASRTADHVAKIADVAVTAGTATVVDIVLTATGNIAGTVHLGGVSDYSGVLVYIAGTSYMAISDSNGDYVISDVPLGAYEIVTNAYEYDVAKVAVTLAEAGVTAVSYTHLTLPTN